ncbi:hypothetical protein D8674_039111 [Pyrus ussuriensis x Pyrus communis]|uniref:Uncharacterized protein n=1 Tax=Pyrus ussuriensis x Pyrus communis TaxID=2448454 RepID=A0A5N5GFV4_9ROSA|nr:hypothetical protein D8674_039111 [Pyrus ussuriensis x Pyrus communis]
MDLQFSFEVSVSNGVSRFANFDLRKEEKEERWCGGSGSLQKQERRWRMRRTMVEKERSFGTRGSI